MMTDMRAMKRYEELKRMVENDARRGGNDRLEIGRCSISSGVTKKRVVVSIFLLPVQVTIAEVRDPQPPASPAAAVVAGEPTVGATHVDGKPSSGASMSTLDIANTTTDGSGSCSEKTELAAGTTMTGGRTAKTSFSESDMTVVAAQIRTEVTVHLIDDHTYHSFQSLQSSFDILWIGWPGVFPTSEAQEAAIFRELLKLNMIPVFLSRQQVKIGYENFAENVLWRLLNYLPHSNAFDEDSWSEYRALNTTFAEHLFKYTRTSDLFFVLNHELLLLPELLREKYSEGSIGFFMGSNFPAQEIFCVLPWREELLGSIMKADLVGFYLHDCLRQFLSTIYQLSGKDNKLGRVTINEHTLTTDYFPIALQSTSIFHKNQHSDARSETDTGMGASISLTCNKENVVLSSSEADQLFVQQPGVKQIITIDHLHGTRSPIHIVNLFELFLENYPDQQGKVSLVLVVVPPDVSPVEDKLSSGKDSESELSSQLNATVTRINGAMANLLWMPVIFRYRKFNQSERRKLYRSAEVAFMASYLCNTSLYPYEYIVSRSNTGGRKADGVLVLSENSAADVNLNDAIHVNPFDADDTISALLRAVMMSQDEQHMRMKSMYEAIQKMQGECWAPGFIYKLEEAADLNRSSRANILVGAMQEILINKFFEAQSRLVILSYDGTLVNFVHPPHMAIPDPELKDLLSSLGKDERTTVVLNTGRDRQILSAWFGDVVVDLVAEHGVWVRRNQEWKQLIELSRGWKSEVKPLIESFVDKTPGSFIEDKENSIAWHYRNVDAELGIERIREVTDMLKRMTAHSSLCVSESSKVIDIKASGFDKGNAIKPWLNEKDWDFIIAIGNSPSDEETFRVLPENAFDIKVGSDPTKAAYYFPSYEHVRPFLRDLKKKCFQVDSHENGSRKSIPIS